MKDKFTQKTKLAPALVVDLNSIFWMLESGRGLERKNRIALMLGSEEKLWEYRRYGYVLLATRNYSSVAYGTRTTDDAQQELKWSMDLFKENPFHMATMNFHDENGTEEPYRHRSLGTFPDIGLLYFMELQVTRIGYCIDWNNSIVVSDDEVFEELSRNARMEFRTAREFFER